MEMMNTFCNGKITLQVREKCVVIQMHTSLCGASLNLVIHNFFFFKKRRLSTFSALCIGRFKLVRVKTVY